MAQKSSKQKKTWGMSDANVSALVQAFLSMKSTAEMRAFMRDLLTESEIIEFSKRFYAARAIAKGVRYADIEEYTGLSSRTIARVKEWYTKGKGGYTLAIRRNSKSAE